MYPSFGKTQVKHYDRQALQMQGINLTDNYADGQMQSCYGISTARFPYITTSQKLVPIETGITEGYHAISMYTWDEKLFVVSDEPADGGGYKCYYATEYCGNVTTLETPKQYAVVNSKLVIFPDKVMFQKIDDGITATSMITATMLKRINTGEITYTHSDDEDTPHGTLTVESDTNLGLSTGDVIFLEGLHHPQADGRYTVATYSYSVTTAEITFEENFPYSYTQNAQEEQLKIYNDGLYCPDMDYICSLHNRLWGCSNKTRIVYASALGDPTDFWTFAGDALDAYQVVVGTSGEFTGMVPLNNNVLIFKQHYIHKMLGSYPAEYQLYTYDVDGASDTNGLSAVNADGNAIYVTEHGIGTYSGASSGILSRELGEGNMNGAIGMFNGELYYLYYKDDQEEPHTYIYDTRYNLWIEEDYSEVMAFAHCMDKDYVLCRENYTDAPISLVDDNGNTIWEYGASALEVVDTNNDTVWDSSSGDPAELYDINNRLIWPQGSSYGTIYLINSEMEYGDGWPLELSDKFGNIVWSSNEEVPELTVIDQNNTEVWRSNSGIYAELYDGDGDLIWPLHEEIPGMTDRADWYILYKPFFEMFKGSWGSASHIFEKKRYTGIAMRMELPKGSWIKAEIRTDDGRWHPVVRRPGIQNRVLDFVIKTPRVDKVQLRLSGHGPMTILGMDRQYTIGSRR